MADASRSARWRRRLAGLLPRALAVVERAGNALPHPATLFLLMALGVIVVSGVASRFGISAVHPGTGETIEVVSLLSVAGLHRILEEMVVNFTGFAPLGTVFVAMLGIGTVIATMLPYTVVFLVGWMAMLGIWLALGLPVGPGAPLTYPAG